LVPSDEEITYMKRHPGMAAENLAFRRAALATEFVGDARLFSCKYPSDPYDGWLGSTQPVMPVDVLRTHWLNSVVPPDRLPHGCAELDPPKPGNSYLICADPAGFGGSGDLSALSVWDAVNRIEVASWEGREDPGLFSQRLLTVQRRYNKAMLAVESNAAACIAMLKDKGARNLLWTDRHHPGWYATEKRVQEAEARLVRMLRDDDITIRSRPLLHQLISYDGSRKSRVATGDGNTQHFDLARTAVMAADILSRRRFTAEEIREVPQEVEHEDGGRITIHDLDRFRRQTEVRNRGLFRPISRG
jgi:hypothetical protein